MGISMPSFLIMPGRNQEIPCTGHRAKLFEIEPRQKTPACAVRRLGSRGIPGRRKSKWARDTITLGVPLPTQRNSFCP